jgi:hypothetical protein
MSKPLTGEQVFESFNQSMIEEAREQGQKKTMIPIRLWERLHDKEKRIYEGMAFYLNQLQAEQEGKP